MTEKQQLALIAAVWRGDCLHTCRLNFCEECRTLLTQAVKSQVPADKPNKPKGHTPNGTQTT